MEEFDVFIVDRPDREFPHSWRNAPLGANCLGRALHAIPGWAASAWARAFNASERAHPLGLWAVVLKTNSNIRPKDGQ